MNNKRATKRALLTSVTALVMCVVMLAGTTFAWFTDTASTGVNKIVAGNLDVDIVGADPVDGKYPSLTGEGHKLSFTKAGTEVGTDNAAAILWEPGCRYVTEGFRIANKGNLALKWKAVVNKGTTAANEGNFDLLDVIDFYLVTSKDVNDMGTELDEFSDKLAAKTDSGVYYIKGVMKTTAGNDYQGLTLDGITITVYATQDTVENDSFGPDYDKNATYYPVLDAAGMKDALVNGGNIKVDADVNPDKTLVATKETTIDMNGKTIANTTEVWSGNDWSLISAQEGANLTITGNGTFQAKENDCYAVDVQDGATVTIENGTFIGNIHAVYVLEGTAYIKGGFYSVQQKYPDAAKADGFVLNCYDANRNAGTAKIIVTGGTFVNFNPADCWAEGPNTNFVAKGYSVISEKHGEDTWYTVVKGTGATAGTQTELDNAITGNETPTVKLTTAGTYTLPALTDKDVTIIGTKDTVIDMKNEVRKASSASFEGVTVEFANATYKGFQHTGKLTYKDCTIKGLQFLYADDVEFINCEFVQENDDAYHVWTYGAKNVTFTDCKFNSTSNSKSVLCYIEGTGNTFTRTFNNCTFTATGVAEKSAIMINPSANAGSNTYIVSINNCTATGYAENGISGQTIVGVKETVKDNITVTINGATVYTH